jgi:metal-dependent amidase/aminoacylase/carboxypeptidase family protein
MAESRLRQIAHHSAETFGAQADVAWKKGYPVMANSPEETEFAAAVAEQVSGRPTEQSAPIMAGEDFAYMLQSRPGAYILIGNGDSASVHHAAYNFNDEAIPAGCSWWAGIIETAMPAA